MSKKGSVQCAFCHSPATTGEHLWSGWLGRLLGEKSKYMMTREKDGKTLRWKSVGLNEKAPVLCKPCNNEWGSDIETKAKAILEDMALTGLPKKLNQSDVGIIAVFVLTKSFVADYMEMMDRLFYDFTERSSFRRTLAIPSGTHIWFASTPKGHGIFKAAYIQMPQNTPNRFEGYVFTVSMGNLSFRLQEPGGTRNPEDGIDTHPALPKTPFGRVPLSRFGPMGFCLFLGLPLFSWAANVWRSMSIDGRTLSGAAGEPIFGGGGETHRAGVPCPHRCMPDQELCCRDISNRMGTQLG